MGKLFLFLKKIYNKIPVDRESKLKLKGKFYRTFGRFFQNTTSYIQWKAYQNWMEQREWLEKHAKNAKQGALEIDWRQAETFECSGSIAIHLHLFYPDLMEEFAQYFSHMPYTFDLYISIIDDRVREEVLRKASGIPKVGQVVVRKVENRGRDVAPLLATFGKELLNYDYFCHVHSKKSLYTGGEQLDWRQYLLEHLFGSEELIRAVFYGFEQGEKVGMIYPETFPDMPYWGHAWLQNEKSRDELLAKTGLSCPPGKKYIDFPMGTMFWARTQALRQFFEAGLRTEDFPEENGQTDGTIAHAFERCTVLACRYNEYNTLIYNGKTREFIYNEGRKNFEQYYIKSFERLKEEANQCEIVSFDIFDTLVSRAVARPDDAFDLLELQLRKNGFSRLQFKELRKEAEGNCRKKNPDRDCDLDDIYQEFSVLSKLSAEDCERIKQAEVNQELRLIEPKKEMAAFYHEILAQNKHVFLVSDMYLRRKDIEKILEKCGITGYEKLFLSCETNLRKDDGSFWKTYSEKYHAPNWLHIGDNEKSDMQIPSDYKFRASHILSIQDLYECSDLGEVYPLRKIPNPIMSVAVGLSLKRLFNHPYALNQDLLDLRIRKEEDFGYAVIAPVIMGYMNHLCRKVLEQKAEKIFFFAREGYLLKELFDIMKDMLPALSSVGSEYLYVSRRALSMASVKTWADIKELLSIQYRGTFSDLLHTRFGMESSEGREDSIALPEEMDKVAVRVEKYQEKILKRAEQERNNYLNYYHTKKIGKEHRIFVSDIGYSGTIQYYLSKLTGDTFDGYYFATDFREKPLAIEGNSIHGYYAEKDSYQGCSRSFVHRYHLLLESILIAPDGQLVCMDEEGACMFAETGTKYYTDEIIRCQEGIKQYFRDFYGICAEYALSAEIDKEFPEGLMRAAVEDGILHKDLEQSFVVEDFYCSDLEISVLQHYREKGLEEPGI